MNNTAHGAAPNSPLSATDEMKQHEALRLAASAALHRALEEETGWIRVHAAEALIGLGETGAARVRFEAELRPSAPKEFEIGTWRVLAASAPVRDRGGWTAKIEARLLEKGPDVATAIESLDKLNHRLSASGLAIVRDLVAREPEQETLLPLWALQIAGEPGAMDKIVAKLQSTQPVARRRAGYVLRWLKPDNASVRAALARAAIAEPPGTDVQVYLLSAALAMRVAPDRDAGWVANLKEVLRSEKVEAHMRFEASHALASRLMPTDLEFLAPLLQANHGDVRIGAAMMILHVLGMPGARKP